MQKAKHEYASSAAEAARLGYTWDEYMAKVYADCLETERKREYWRDNYTSQGAFEAGFIRYQQLLEEGETEDKLPLACPLGETISDAERSEILLDRRIKLMHAFQKLRRNKLGYLVRTLQLIARNGANREKSIWQMTLDSLKKSAAQEEFTSTTGKVSAGSSRSKLGSKKVQNEHT